MQEVHNLIVDIGNSSVKYCLDNNAYFSLFDLEKQLRKKDNARFDVFVISSVEAKIKVIIDDLKATFNNIGKVEVFDPIQQCSIKGVYPGLGADRVAKVLGAKKLFPEHAIVLVDFGTASACSIAAKTNNEKFFLGGFISIGFKASLRALNNQCDALEDLSESEELENLVASYEDMQFDSSTPAAMIQGSYAAHIGLVKEWQIKSKQMIERFFSQNNIDALPIKTICTGGQARFFEKLFDAHIPSEQLLTACFLDACVLKSHKHSFVSS